MEKKCVIHNEGRFSKISFQRNDRKILVFCSLHQVRTEVAKPKHSPLAAVNVFHFQFAKMHFAKKIENRNKFARSVFAQPCELQNKNAGSFAK